MTTEIVLSEYNKLAKIFVDTVFEDIGVRLTPPEHFSSKMFVVVGDYIDINPKMLGPAAILFTSMRVLVLCGAINGVLMIQYKFEWKHESGSNGYTVHKNVNSSDF